MNRPLLAFAAAILVSTLALRAEAPGPFDPKEKISLDLKDAKLTEVVTLLGALANVPVYIDPDVDGTVSVHLVDTPYEDVLKQVTRETGVFIRMEGGKLVASRSRTSLLPAVTLPDRHPEGPRVSVEDYPKGFTKLPPLFLRQRPASGEACSRLVFESGEPPTFEIPGADGPTLVTQFGWEPISRTRFLAVETKGALSALPYSDSDSPAEAAGWSMSARAGENEPCAEPRRRAGGGEAVTLLLEIREGGDEGMRVIAGPRLNVIPGRVFSMRSGLKGDTGQHREYIVHGFLSADGRSAAATLVATAIWVDLKDGREYVYSQTAPGRTVKAAPLSRDSALYASLPAGAALARPLDLSISLAEKKSAADQAALDHPRCFAGAFTEPR